MSGLSQSARSRCGRLMVGSGTDTYDPTCDLPEGHIDVCRSFGAIDQHRLGPYCAQCGREGVRGFRVIPPTIHEPTGSLLGPMVVCANENACRKRWPKVNDDELERMYA